MELADDDFRSLFHRPVRSVAQYIIESITYSSAMALAGGILDHSILADSEPYRS